MARQSSLPPTLAPRLIMRQAAADYLCISVKTFNEKVKNGDLPSPKLIHNGKQVWDVRELDAAVDALPRDGDDDDRSWDDFDAPPLSPAR